MEALLTSFGTAGSSTLAITLSSRSVRHHVVCIAIFAVVVCPAIVWLRDLLAPARGLMIAARHLQQLRIHLKAQVRYHVLHIAHLLVVRCHFDRTGPQLFTSKEIQSKDANGRQKYWVSLRMPHNLNEVEYNWLDEDIAPVALSRV